MKTYKLISQVNDILTFTENDLTYTLSIDSATGDPVEILQATDTGNGIKFTNKFNKELDYSEADYLRLFLNLIEQEDKSLFESYIVTEPVGIL